MTRTRWWHRLIRRHTQTLWHNGLIYWRTTEPGHNPDGVTWRCSCGTEWPT